MDCSWIIFTVCLLHLVVLRICESSDEAGTEESQQEDKDKSETEEDPDKSEYEAEKKAGDRADMLANRHYSYLPKYDDFGRRFVPQYPYTEIKVPDQKTANDIEAENKLDKAVKMLKQKQDLIQEDDPKLLPVEAPPEVVLDVAIKSAIYNAAAKNEEDEPNEQDQKKMLRSGDFWDALWVEDFNPEKMLRTNEEPNLVGSSLSSGTTVGVSQSEHYAWYKVIPTCVGVEAVFATAVICYQRQRRITI